MWVVILLHYANWALLNDKLWWIFYPSEHAATHNSVRFVSPELISSLLWQMGSNIKLQHAFSETTRSGISKWREKAVKSSKPHPKPKEKLHSKPKEKPRQLAGIVGINKEVDEQGRARSIELPQRGTQHGHKQHPHPHGHHQHPHPPHHGNNSKLFVVLVTNFCNCRFQYF